MIALLILILVLSACGLQQSATETTSVAEAGGMWYAWLHRTQSDELVRVFENGETERYSLGISETDFPMQPVFKDEQVAFCMIDRNDEINPTVSVVVRNVVGEQNTAEIPFTGGDCNVSGFSTDGSLVAVGSANFAAVAPNMETDDPEWRLRLINSQNGQVMDELTSDSPAFQAVDQDQYPNMAAMPRVQSFV